MGKLTLLARVLLGLVFFVFGLNGFFEFLEEPTHNPEATVFLTGIGTGDYMWPMIKAVETVCGFALLVGLFVPLALTVLAPIVVNILAFHIFLAPDPQAQGIAIAVTGLTLFLAFSYRGNFKPMLNPKAAPC